jgi:hypothetical protein
MPGDTNLVALRDRREQVIARISECYADDILDVDELDRRLDLAHGARTLPELDALVADLAAPSPSPSPASTPSTALVPVGASPLAIDDPARPPAKRLRALLSSVTRRGRWTVPKQLEVRTFWGSVELDFRDASLGPGVTTIDVHVTMANLEVILPPGLSVDVDVSCFAGNVEQRHRVPPDDDPARPMLRFTGAVRFGNFEITTRLPGDGKLLAVLRDVVGAAKSLVGGSGGREKKKLPPGDSSR